MADRTAHAEAVIALLRAQAPIVERLLVDAVEKLEAEVELGQDAELAEAWNADLSARRGGN